MANKTLSATTDNLRRVRIARVLLKRGIPFEVLDELGGGPSDLRLLLEENNLKIGGADVASQNIKVVYAAELKLLFAEFTGASLGQYPHTRICNSTLRQPCIIKVEINDF